MNVLEGKVVAQEMKVGIVVARFNEFYHIKITGRCPGWSDTS